MESTDSIVQYSGPAKAAESVTVEAVLAPVVRTYDELSAALTAVEGKSKVATSGFFNPIHKNHISNIISSKHLAAELLTEHDLPSGIHLTVVVNGDWSTKEKLGGDVFLPAEHRADVVRALAGVDLVFIHDVEVSHQGDLIALGLFDVFTKGGDRDFASLPTAEQDALRATGTLMVGNVGPDKFEGTAKEVSSSKLRAIARGEEG